MQNQDIQLDKILSGLKIKQLNDMQQASLEANEKRSNVILLSDTGSGKTLAFLLPVLQNINLEIKGTQALIVAPSRELALQIEDVFKKMQTGYKVTCCYGGHLRETEENNLKEAPAVIVGTSGRLADHIRRGNITLDTIETLVLDEFDKSLELGFQEELKFIISSLPNLKKRILTSATDEKEIPDFIGMKKPEKLNFLSGKPKETNILTIQKIVSPGKDKIETLFKLVCFFNQRSSIVFCNHRESVERVSELLWEKGVTNVFYHGQMEQKQRETALSKFRNGSSNILITTDLAARGLDIPNIRYIVHYQLPLTEETYTHRNGRTARMDNSGTVILILSENEKLPKYIDPNIEDVKFPANLELPEKPKWTTLYIGAGKKDKVNKIDIVGFLSAKGQLKKEDIGLVEVKDFTAYVAIRKNKVGHTLQLIKDERLKGKKIKFEVAK